jgi:hypothetical protein
MWPFSSSGKGQQPHAGDSAGSSGSSGAASSSPASMQGSPARMEQPSSSAPSSSSSPSSSSWAFWKKRTPQASPEQPASTGTDALREGAKLPGRKIKLVEVQPMHVVVAGSCVMVAGAQHQAGMHPPAAAAGKQQLQLPPVMHKSKPAQACSARGRGSHLPSPLLSSPPSLVPAWHAGALATGVSTYRSGAKGFVEDGINPDVRLKIIPVAVRGVRRSQHRRLQGLRGFVDWLDSSLSEPLLFVPSLPASPCTSFPSSSCSSCSSSGQDPAAQHGFYRAARRGRLCGAEVQRGAHR